MDANVKVLIVGNSGCGKSCLVKRYLSESSGAAPLFDASSQDPKQLPPPTVGFDATSKMLRGIDLEAKSLTGGSHKVKVFFLDTCGNNAEGSEEAQQLAYGPILVHGVVNAPTPSALVVVLVFDVEDLHKKCLTSPSITVKSVTELITYSYVSPLLKQLAEVSEGSVVVGEGDEAPRKGAPSFVLVGTKCDLLAGADTTFLSSVLPSALQQVAHQNHFSECVLTSSAGIELAGVEATRVFFERMALSHACNARAVWSSATKKAEEQKPAEAPERSSGKDSNTVPEANSKKKDGEEEFPMWNVGREEMKAQVKAFEEASAKAVVDAEQKRSKRATTRRHVIFAAASLLTVVAVAIVVTRRMKASRQ